MHLDDAALHSISHFSTMLASCKFSQVCFQHHIQHRPCNGVSMLLPCILDCTPEVNTCHNHMPL